jgi:hypothetical protein
MTRVYMAAEDNDAGVLVVENAFPKYPVRVVCEECATVYTTAEFRAVIEGGLRWMYQHNALYEGAGPSEESLAIMKLLEVMGRKGR